MWELVIPNREGESVIKFVTGPNVESSRQYGFVKANAEQAC
jgi:hypothetical protein